MSLASRRVGSISTFVLACTAALLPFFVVLKLLLVLDDSAAGATPAPHAARFVARVLLALHRDALFILALGLASGALLWAADRVSWATRGARLFVLFVYAVTAGWATGTYFLWQVVHGTREARGARRGIMTTGHGPSRRPAGASSSFP